MNVKTKLARDIELGDQIWHSGNDTFHTVRKVEPSERTIKIWAGDLYCGDVFFPHREFDVAC